MHLLGTAFGNISFFIILEANVAKFESDEVFASYVHQLLLVDPPKDKKDNRTYAERPRKRRVFLLICLPFFITIIFITTTRPCVPYMNGVLPTVIYLQPMFSTQRAMDQEKLYLLILALLGAVPWARHGLLISLFLAREALWLLSSVPAIKATIRLICGVLVF